MRKVKASMVTQGIKKHQQTKKTITYATSLRKATATLKNLIAVPLTKTHRKTKKKTKYKSTPNLNQYSTERTVLIN